MVSSSSRLVAVSVIGAIVVLYVVGSLRSPASVADASPGLAEVASISPSPGSDAPDTTFDAPVPGTSAIESTPTATVTPGATPRPTARIAATCRPTDQDQFVYNPSRLEVLRSCIRVTGTVAAVRHEADGDLHILLALDPPDRGLLRPANQGEELGDLVIEPVCVRGVTQADAVDVCATDPDPMPGPFPTVGEHVWMDGRYVLDLEHGGWAELHPLYRWGG